MAIETLDYTYTSRAEMARLFGEDAIQLREDDDQDGVAESSVIQDAIDEATDTINAYADSVYDPSEMADNLQVRRWATKIACHYLSLRRGNPAQYQAEYDRIIGDLQAVQYGKRRIPRLNYRADLTPGVSNYRVDDRYQIKKTRVEQQISTGGRHTRQDVDNRRYADEHIYP